MRSKPWPLVLLALFQILTPVGTILFNAWALEVKPLYVLHWILEKRAIEVFEYLFLMPIAGLALLRMKAWSYVVFFAAMAWSMEAAFRHWHYASHAFPLWKVLIVYAFQMALALYFLIPSVRKTYLDRNVRWWEAKRRFKLEIPVWLETAAGRLKGSTRNVSEGGILAHFEGALENGTQGKLGFELAGVPFEIQSRVVYRSEPGAESSYGIQFIHTHETHARFRKLSRALALLGVRDREAPFARPWHVGAQDWLVTLLRTGKGWVPDVKSSRRGKPG